MSILRIPVCSHIYFHLTVADLRGGARDARPPGGPNSFIFMQFSAKKKSVSTPTLGVGAPQGKSWIHHCFVLI